MNRAPLGDQAYWDGRVKRFADRIAADKSNLGFTSKNPASEPQYWFNHSRYSFRLIMLRYSRGDAVDSILQDSFQDVLDSWSHSNVRARDWQSLGGSADCRDWQFALHDLNFYNWCFWVSGLALLLEVPDAQWLRLLALIGDEGQDQLLDSTLASRQGARKIGTALLHPAPYARLMRVLEVPRAQRPAQLADFVQHWYGELARKPGAALWWHAYGDPVRHPLEKGSYFGRWCIEAAAVAKMFDIDDASCLAEEHYPGALVHPESQHAAVVHHQVSVFSRLRQMFSSG